MQLAILDWLAAERIWHIRLNTGAMAGSHKGKKWFVRFGRPGMADILAIKYIKTAYGDSHHVNWLECKTPNGRLSPAQREFCREVSEQGHNYYILRSLDEAIAILK